MHGSAAMLLGQVEGAPAFQGGLCALERHLFYMVMETFTHEYRSIKGISKGNTESHTAPTNNKKHLNPEVKPFAPKSEGGLEEQNTKRNEETITTQIGGINMQEENKEIEQD